MSILLKELDYLASDGDHTASAILGFLYEHGVFFDQDDRQAESFYKKGYEDSNSFLSYLYGSFLLQKGRIDEAVLVIEKLSKSGHVQAAYFLGSIYETREQYGMGMAIDQYKYAAELGCRKATCRLGRFYENTDKDKSLHWYKASAEMGDSHACLTLYKLCKDDDSQQEAIEYLHKAARLNNGSAHSMLSMLYKGGLHSFPQDDEKSAYHEKESERLRLLEKGLVAAQGKQLKSIQSE